MVGGSSEVVAAEPPQAGLRAFGRRAMPAAHKAVDQGAHRYPGQQPTQRYQPAHLFTSVLMVAIDTSPWFRCWQCPTWNRSPEALMTLRLDVVTARGRQRGSSPPSLPSRIMVFARATCLIAL